MKKTVVIVVVLLFLELLVYGIYRYSIVEVKDSRGALEHLTLEVMDHTSEEMDRAQEEIARMLKMIERLSYMKDQVSGRKGNTPKPWKKVYDKKTGKLSHLEVHGLMTEIGEDVLVVEYTISFYGKKLDFDSIFEGHGMRELQLTMLGCPVLSYTDGLLIHQSVERLTVQCFIPLTDGKLDVRKLVASKKSNVKAKVTSDERAKDVTIPIYHPETGKFSHWEYEGLIISGPPDLTTPELSIPVTEFKTDYTIIEVPTDSDETDKEEKKE